MKEPESMDELLYYTRRTLGKGKVMAWVNKKDCKCGGKMGKPVEKGKVKIRAPLYVCPKCGLTEEKKAHEESCELQVKFTCPHCGKDGEGSTLYKRKTYKGVKAYLVNCPHCDGKVPVSKKMKNIDL
ncbi:hypothetical protein ACFL1B_03035 [Nanoarchaeota archaeon]